MARLVPDSAWGILTVWMEARGEPQEGKIAVAECIRNRVDRKYQCNGTVADCVLRPNQFSSWSTNDANRRLAAVLDDEDPIVKACAAAWLSAMTGSALAHGAVLYVNLHVVAIPTWASRCTKVAEIGAHTFYTDP